MFSNYLVITGGANPAREGALSSLLAQDETEITCARARPREKQEQELPSERMLISSEDPGGSDTKLLQES